ncbi:MAG: TIGR03016 family PEP-CTERM system-associated outer membrane protein, partial [Nitrococcus mobilis]|nr:TIGR03016 family PEP-CTERM system-associated outer membrane protein [Nitrococcus mobilis]
MPWSVRAAMNWEVTPRARLSEIFTDNVNLSPDDQAKGALVTQFNPGVDISGEGPRARGHLSYTLSGVLAWRPWGDSGTGASNRYQDRLFHRLAADGNAELWKQHLFVDARARRRQFATNLAGPIGIDNTAGFNNLTAVTLISASPYLTNHFGSYADSTLRYRHDRVFVDGGNIADSQTNEFSGNLQSGDAFDPVLWSLNARHTRTRRPSGAGTNTSAFGGPNRFAAGTFNEASATLGYRLTPHFSVSATGGYQDNDFQSIRNSIDGPFWDVGFNWVPNQRTSLAARYGQRFFGKTGSLNFHYRRRNTLWQANFIQRIASLRNTILTDAGAVPIFALDCPPADPSCLPIGEIPVLRPEAVQDFYVLQQGRASVTFSGAKHSATLAYAFLRRTFERDGSETRQQGVNLTWTWRLKSDVRLISAGGWRQIQPQQFSSQMANAKGHLWFIRTGLTRDL